MSKISKFADGFEKWLNDVDRYFCKNKANIGYIIALILCGFLKNQSDFRFSDDIYSSKVEPIRRRTSGIKVKTCSRAADLTYYGSDPSVMTVLAYYDLAKQSDWDSNRLSAARKIKDFFLSKKDDAYDPVFLQSMSIRALRAIADMMEWQSDRETCVEFVKEVAEEEV